MATIADLVIKLSANTGAAEKDLSTFSGKVSRGFGKALLPAVGVLTGLGVAAVKTADKATALGESQNAVNVVFGKSAKTISDFAKVADKEAGLSMRQLNELVTPIGASLINMGDSADVAATKSVTLAKRAADMASVFNVDVSEALGAIQAGLRGEADPLERFGVGLSDAAVKAQAMSMGLAKTEAALTAQDKSQARYALLLEQTNKLQGDFVNTSDSAANAARINAAAQENLQAKMGKGVLPVVKLYQSALSGATKFMSEHTGATKVIVGVLGGLAAAVIAVNVATIVYTAGQRAVRAATVAWTGVQWLLNAALTANPIGIVVVALAALAAGLVIAWTKSETFRTVVTGVFNAVKNAVLTAVSFILGGVDKFLAGVEKMARAASKLPFVGDKFKGLADDVASARDKVQGLQDDVNSLKSKDITVTITTVHKTFHEEYRVPGVAVAGTRAAGGPVRKGLPYLVGEKGPELFTPGANGGITANHQLQGRMAANLGSGSEAPDGDLILMVEGEVLGRISRKHLDRTGRRNVSVSFGDA